VHIHTHTHTQPTLQYTATHCNTLQHTATRTSGQVLTDLYASFTATHCNTNASFTATHCNALQHTATHCNILQHTATHTSGHVLTRLYTSFTATHGSTHASFPETHLMIYCNTQQRTATHCNTLQHTATHCNTLQHSAAHCSAHRLTGTYQTSTTTRLQWSMRVSTPIIGAPLVRPPSVERDQNAIYIDVTYTMDCNTSICDIYNRVCGCQPR